MINLKYMLIYGHLEVFFWFGLNTHFPLIMAGKREWNTRHTCAHAHFCADIYADIYRVSVVQMYSFKSFSKAGSRQLRSLKTQKYLCRELQPKDFACARTHAHTHRHLPSACAFALLTFKFEGVSNEKWVSDWRRLRMVRERGEKRGKIWRHRHLIFPPSGSPSCCSPSFAITFHCHSCLQSPLTTCAALPSKLFVLSLLHPHKWLSETGQVLQNSPWSSTCLIQGLAHCTKTSNTLPTHCEGHPASPSKTYTLINMGIMQHWFTYALHIHAEKYAYI